MPLVTTKEMFEKSMKEGFALDDACNITGELFSAAASTIPCINSILFTLNAPIANPSFIDFSNM